MNRILLELIVGTLSFVLPVKAQDTDSEFSSDENLGWVKPPTTRGSSSIIYSCLSTLFICLYATFHDDVPIAGSGGKVARFLRKAKWIVIGIFAPEIMVVHAGLQLFEARRTITPMKEAGVVNWTLTHGFFVNMGGFVLVQNDPTPVRIPVNGEKLLDVFAVRSPAEWWPKTSREAILDKSKADTLAKILAFVQASWLIAQVIARAVSNLSISPLEIESAAYVPLTLVVHILWWAKPLNIDVPIEVPIVGISLTDILGLDDVPSVQEEKLVPGNHWKGVIVHISGRTFGSMASAISVMALGMIFGGVHCLAWDFRFPTPVEGRLWRAASVFTIIGGFFAHTIVAMVSRTMRRKSLPQRQATFAGRVLRAWDILGYPLCLVYLLARCYLIFESFYSLRSLPGDTFRVIQWTQYVPHL